MATILETAASAGCFTTLMAAVDALNHRYGSGTIRWAACGLRPGWSMRRSRLSRAATTRLDELPRAQA